jgi:hypothetical protein
LPQPWSCRKMMVGQLLRVGDDPPTGNLNDRA